MRYWIGLFLVIPLWVCADDTIKSDCIDHDIAPSGRVAGCVNVISGAFQQHETDIVVPGPEPLTFERHYDTRIENEIGLLGDWKSNHFNFLFASFHYRKGGHGHPKAFRYYMHFYDPTIGHYWPEVEWGRKTPYKPAILTIHSNKDHHQGITNVGSGEISGRTNPLNLKIIAPDFDHDFVNCIFGSGEDRKYRKWKEFFKWQRDNPGTFYCLESKTKTTGNKFGYKFDDFPLVLKEKEVTHTSGDDQTIFGSLNFPKELIKQNTYLERDVIASDGRKVHYVCTLLNGYKDQGKDSNFQIIDVDRPNAPNIHYDYHRFPGKKKALLKKKCLPDQRFTEIEYYLDGNHQISGKRFHCNEKHPCFHKVKSLLQPVGHDATPIVTYRFEYPLQESWKIIDCKTDVYDALNHKTSYGYRSGTLLYVTQFTGNEGNYTPYSKQKLDYQGCFLKAKSVFDENDQLYKKVEYVYDGKGNVTEEKLTGNLTGNETSTYSKYTTFSNDNFNLPLSERDRKYLVKYQYKQGTDLLTAKYQCDINGSILQREFHEYDQDAVCILSIRDDGVSERREDLSGVTCRLIERVTPKPDTPCLGYPLIVENSYLDIESGEEKLLGRKVQTFSLEGWLLTQEVYDAEGSYCYTLTFEYDDHGNVLIEQDALGNVIQRQYDANDNLVLEVGPNPDRQKRYTYDFMNRLIKEEIITSDQHLVQSYRYDYLGNKIASTDFQGNETEHEYDEFSREIRTILPAVSLEDGSIGNPVIEKKYDIGGNVVEEIDPLGNRVSREFNIRGKPTKICYSDGSCETFEYNLDGTLAKSRARNRSQQWYTYDCLGRVVREQMLCDVGNQVYEINRKYSGSHLLSVTDGMGFITEYKYDGAGRKIEESRDGRVTRYEYDSLGRVSRESREFESGFRVSVKEYDFMNRVLEERLEDDCGNIFKKVSYAYDPDGNKTEVISYGDNGTSIHRTVFDALNKPIAMIESDGSRTEVNYNFDFHNEIGQKVVQVTTIDPLGQKKILTQDAVGRVVSTEVKDYSDTSISYSEHFYDLSGRKVLDQHLVIYDGIVDKMILNRFEYDAMGNVICLIEAQGTPEQKVTQYEYTIFGEKSKIIKPDGVEICFGYNARGLIHKQISSDQSIDFNFRYDLNNNLVAVEDLIHDQVTKRVYNSHHQVEKEILGHLLEMNYTHDQLGRTASITFPDEKVATYTHDEAYLREVEFDGHRHQYLTHDLSGRLKEEVNACGHRTNYGFDDAGRLNELNSLTYSVSDFRYDHAGNLKGYAFEDPQGKKTNSYDYDSLYQLTSESGSSNHKYKYDSLNNRRVKDEKKSNYNSLNQLVSFDQQKFNYDMNGNLVYDGSRSFKYDALDRLIQVNTDEQKICYQYDSFNRRLSKQIYEGEALLNEERYIYQGQDEVGCVVGNEITQRRILGVGKGAEIGASVLLEIEGEMFVPTHDLCGSINSLLTTNGDVVESYRFNAFGEMVSSKEPKSFLFLKWNSEKEAINPWRFSSKRHDAETGFIYFGRRYYDSAIGRWISADPKGYDAGPNLYAYVLNNPLTHIDLYGLIAQSNWVRSGDRWMHKDTYHSKQNPHGGKLGNAIFGALKRGAYALGKSFEFATTHAIPLPLLRKPFLGISRFLCGDGLSFEDKSYTPSRYIYYEGRNPDAPPASDGNGILTTDKGSLDNAVAVSRANGFCPVWYLCNSTKGFIGDILESIYEMFGGTTRPVQLRAQNMMDKIDAAGGPDNCPGIFEEAHSESGIILANALQLMPKNYRRKVTVATYGSPFMIPKSYCKDAVNYVSKRDPVSLIIGSPGIVKSFYSDDVEVRFLTPQVKSIVDHSRTGATYMQASVRARREYLTNMRSEEE